MTKIEQKIPEGWSVKKLGDIVNTFSGGTPLAGEATYYKNGTIPFIRSGEIYQDYTELFVTEKGLQESSAKMVNKGDLLFALYGANSGEIAISQIEGAINQAILCIRPKEDNVHYLKNSLILLKDRILHKYLQGGQGNLSAEIVKSLKLLFPPLPEQEKIAGILGTWDDGIEKLSALIEKKKIQKKALMQQLLTGKHRLKGFSTPWHEVKLKDVLYEHKETSKGDETICSVSVHKGIISQIEHLGRSFAASNTSNYNLVHYGDVVYTKSPTGEFPYGIFKQSQQRKSVIVSPLYGVFTPKTYYLGYILDVFFSHAINLNNYLKPIIQKGAKNTINITNETFLSKAIFLPEETTEIQKLAEIFIKADEEIDLLNKKLEALKEQKKGLMQQLLTGQIRVKVN